MSRDFPDWVHPDKAASARRVFSGSAPLDRLKRLDGLVVSRPDAEISFRIGFSRDEQGQVRVDVEVKGVVPMQCQRTLKTYGQPIVGSSVVGIVASEAEAEALPEDYEPQICPDNRLRLLDLVEEEVLLALPLVPTDPDSEEPAAATNGSHKVTEDSTQTHRPFEALAALKKDREKN